jgi:hypothetical protein
MSYKTEKRRGFAQRRVMDKDFSTSGTYFGESGLYFRNLACISEKWIVFLKTGSNIDESGLNPLLQHKIRSLLNRKSF